MTLPETMAALRIHEFGAPPQLDRLPVPEPGPGEVLVRLAASVVSHHDLTVAGGTFVLRPPLPYVPGLEGAGHVAGSGEGVDRERFAIGRAVRVYAGGLGATRPGTWAEYVVAPERAATPVPETLDPAVAAACGSAMTAWTAAIELGALQPGERIGVTGASGAVGSLVVQLATLHGAKSVVGWVRTADKADLLAPGVEPAVGDDPVEPVDLLVDTVGGPLLARRLSAVRPGGRAVLVGYTAGEQVSFSLPDLMAADVSLLPLNMMRRRPPAGLESRLADDFAAGRLRLGVEAFPGGDVVEAIARLRGGTVSGRVVLTW
jgi:NADPH:quinone reductase-like Zn-dependent oxidoreductase